MSQPLHLSLPLGGCLDRSPVSSFSAAPSERKWPSEATALMLLFLIKQPGHQPLWADRDVLIRLTGAEWRRLSERKRRRNTFPRCCPLCSNSAPLHLYRSWVFFLFSDAMCFYWAFQLSAAKMLSAQMPDGCTIQLSALRVKWVCVLRRINTNASPGSHQTWWVFFLRGSFHLWIQNKTKELTK